MLNVKLSGASRPDTEPLVLRESEARQLFKRLDLPLQADLSGDFSARSVQEQCQEVIRDQVIPLAGLEGAVFHLLSLAEDEIATSSCRNGGLDKYANIVAEPCLQEPDSGKTKK